ncbi:sugar porter family MFS transporter [Chitinophaga japonensis]|uniref:Sugar porter (SP) family MFS transporter n=1 Tax=Chitinophaga japonensis TaxID=104662 RepID=A0A562T2E7_CHIJA|nr:sugar porter family MFS transporter [Chitinophaga japonensis]TWI86996.1 sugar porter (SP) family MFS transporter [Chitinophaga japonensis]
MNKQLFTGCLVAALGGLLFGADTAVISGAEQSIKEVFHLEGFWHGFTNAIALIGTIIGAIGCGAPLDKYGRKKVLVIVAVLYIVSALGCGLSQSWLSFLVYRFMGGLGIGASSVAGPMYISEIAPPRLRGRLVALFQFNIVLGILLAYFSNYFINNWVATDAWRWMLGIQAVPSLIFFLLLYFIPESPRWLMKRHRTEDARRVLAALGNRDADGIVAEIADSLKAESSGQTEKLFTRRFSFPVMCAVLLATFNQFSGINAIMYYAPRIFSMTGLARDTALLQAVLIGLTNMVFTVIAMSVIDKFGRRTLLIAGSVGMILFLGLTARAFYYQDFGGYMVLIYLVGFIASFAFSQGAVIWVFLAEIFPNSVRAKGQALGSFTHWFWAAVMTWLFPMVAELPYGGTFAFSFFCIAMVLHLLFAVKMLPETRGKSLEELSKAVLR